MTPEQTEKLRALQRTIDDHSSDHRVETWEVLKWMEDLLEILTGEKYDPDSLPEDDEE